MKTKLLTAFALVCSLAAMAQSDTVFTRQVTVEKEFEPTVQSAGIIPVRPSIVQQEMSPVEVSYSDYSMPLSPSFNINPLGCSLTNWTQPKPLNGYVSGGLGHTNTVFDFGYRMDDKRRKVSVDTYAHHRAAWGRYTVEKTTFGLNLKKTFSETALFFGADAGNQYYTFSGRYVDSTNTMHIAKASQFAAEDKLSLWTINTHIGLCSAGRQNFQYLVQTGYSAFMYANLVTEHQIRTKAQMAYKSSEHSGGVNIQVANLFMSVNDASILPSQYNSRHALRIEPFYAYDSKRLHAHIGVNLDVNIGRGQLLSSNKNIAFAPSPNIYLEYTPATNWLALYGEARGSFSEGSMQAYTQIYPYRTHTKGVTSHHVPAYIPVQAQLGLKLRPQANLLVNLFGRYEMKLNQLSLATPYYWEVQQARVAAGDNSLLYGDYVYSNLQRWKIGAEISYHYQDMLTLFIAGGFYTGSMDNIETPSGSTAAEEASLWAAVKDANGNFKMLDRPRWDVTVNVDVRINRNWSLYSHNYFAGSRLALMWEESHSVDATGAAVSERIYSTRVLMPTIELDLGCRYDYNKWLSVFVELNNFIHRHNYDYYGYTSPGANFVLGATYRF